MMRNLQPRIGAVALKALPQLAALLAASLVAGSSSLEAQAPAQQFQVLDGDTVVVGGSAYRIAGIDAPELGPWAKCWAEAALAGHAKDGLERLLSDSEGRGWQLRDVSASGPGGKLEARLADQEGYDIIDDMVVYGYAARTTGRWDWCGEDADLHHVLEDESPPTDRTFGGLADGCLTHVPATKECPLSTLSGPAAFDPKQTLRT